MVTDVSVGTVKLVTGLLELLPSSKSSASFTTALVLINSRVTTIESISLYDTLENVKNLETYMLQTVFNAKERHDIKDRSVINGSEGTISHHE